MSLFLQGFEFQISVVVMASVTLLPDFRAEHRIWVHERDCSLQEPQQARHLCRHFAYSTAGVLQLPERPEKEKNPERKLIHSQESIKHFLLKSYCQTELECCQVTSQILEHQGKSAQKHNLQSSHEAHMKYYPSDKPEECRGQRCQCDAIFSH